MHATLSAKGQITVPKAVREHLGLREGDRIQFHFDRGGLVHLVAEKAASPLQGIIGLLSHLAPAEPVSIEAMNEAIRLHAQRKPEH